MSASKRGLKRIELACRGRKALDGLKIVPISLNGQHDARSHRLAIEQDRAGAAYAVLTTDMGAGQPEILSNEVAEKKARLNFARVADAVDGNADLHAEILSQRSG